MDRNQPFSLEQQATNYQTFEHINTLMKLLALLQIEIIKRQFTHDRSKLKSPEVEVFTEFTPKLRASTYGSEEYKEFLHQMKPALDHHYSHNRHHPEFFPRQERCEEIDNHIAMVNWAIKHAQALPDDTCGYLSIIEFLEKSQAEHQSSVNNMNLVDLVEMFCDWKAATMRHDNGNLDTSIEINKARFNLSPQIVNIFKNSVSLFGNDIFEGLETQKDLDNNGGES